LTNSASQAERKLSRPPADPVFVGGTGRSGTTITGALVRSHPRYAGVSFEIKLHALTRFVTRGNRPLSWLQDIAHSRYESALHRQMDAESFQSLLDDYTANHTDDPVGSARHLTEGIMDRIAASQGKPSWVEMTPYNALCGSWLHKMFPDMRLVHMLRDGRDVAASVSATWGQMSVEEALHWWTNRTAKAFADSRRLPDGVIHVVNFESLARYSRERTYGELLDFLGIDDHPAMRGFFERSLTADRANIGRWKRGRSKAKQGTLTKMYRESLTELRDNGMPVPLSPEGVT